MAEESDQSVVAHLESSVVPLVPGLRARLESGIDVVDLRCGLGRALQRLARAFPRSRFVGYDLSADVIATARAEAVRLGLGNLSFEVRDLTHLDERRRLHHAGHPGPDGDRRQPGQPVAPWPYTVSCLHCMTVSFAQGGQGLGTAWGREQALALLHASGFGQVHVHELEHDPVNDWYVATRS